MISLAYKKKFKKACRSTLLVWVKHKQVALLFLALASILLPANLYPQNKSPRFLHVSLEDGLSNAKITAILQDRHGFMWFGTEDGLNKYDGFEITVYNLAPEDSDRQGRYSITALHEDADGMLWIAGYGLGRFDPATEQVTHYRHDPEDPHSLSDDLLITIYEDREGVLWVGTDKGLNRMDRATGRFVRYQHDPDDPHSLSAGRALAITEDRLGNIWVGTDNGLNRFDRTTGQFTRYTHDPSDLNSLSDNRIRTMITDRAGKLWISDHFGGLNRLDPATGRVTRIQRDFKDPNRQSTGRISHIYEDRSGIFWMSVIGEGLHRFDPATGRVTRYWHDPNNPNSLSHDIIISVYEDRAGWLWVGTRGSGVDRFNPSAVRRVIHYKANTQDPFSLTHSAVYVIHEDQDDVLWIGLTTGDLDVLDRITDRFTKHRSAKESRLRDLHTSPSEPGVLWIASGNGLERYDHRAAQSTFYRHNPHDPHSISRNRIYVIHEDRGGSLWIGTLGGDLNRLDRATGRFTRYQHDPTDPHSLSNGTNVWAIHEDRAGALWVGTEGGGLNRLDRATGRFTRYQHDLNDPYSLGNNHVYAIHEDARGRFWIGTRGGLYQMDRAAGRFTHVLNRDTPSSDVKWPPRDWIRGILEDDAGNLWISTGKGFSILRADTDEGFDLRHYEAIDGEFLPSFFIGSFLKSRRGELYFGSENGLYRLDPALLGDDVAPAPPVFITDVKLFGESIAVRPDGSTPLKRHITNTEEIVLPPDADIITFSFAALDYADPLRTEYAYKLEGFNDDWLYQGTKREATFTDLDPGSYVLQVKAANSAGSWNEVGALLKVTILPSWWQTWWFRTLSVMFVIVALLYGYKIRVRNMQARNVQLQETVAARTADLAAKNEQLKDFAHTVSHDLKAPLRGISGYAQELVRRHNDGLTMRGQHCTKEIVASSRELENLIEDLLLYARMESEDVAVAEMEIEEVITSVLKEFNDKKGKGVQISTDFSFATMRCWQRGLSQIMSNLIGNAVKYSREAECPVVNVKGEETSTTYRISVADNGMGFDMKNHDRIFQLFHRLTPNQEIEGTGAGLAIVKKVVEKQGGKVWAESEPGKGATFFVELPKQKV